jgi:hypothetical protein
VQRLINDYIAPAVLVMMHNSDPLKYMRGRRESALGEQHYRPVIPARKMRPPHTTNHRRLVDERRIGQARWINSQEKRGCQCGGNDNRHIVVRAAISVQYTQLRKRSQRVVQYVDSVYMNKKQKPNKARVSYTLHLYTYTAVTDT